MLRLLIVAGLIVVGRAVLPAHVVEPIYRSLESGPHDLAALRRASAEITALERGRRLARVAATGDRQLPGVRHQRFRQLHQGVPVWGSTLTLQERDGVPITTFGGVIDVPGGLDPSPRRTAAEARAAAANRAGVPIGPFAAADLYVLPRTADVAHLVYVVTATTRALERVRYFVDAHDGTIVDEQVDRRTAAAVGVGTGVLGDRKKVSASTLGGLFVAIDLLRPTPLHTYDLAGDIDATVAVLNGMRPLHAADLAADADNVWTDPAAVDAHVHSGLTYDYLFKRFGRLGIDDAGLPIVNLVHPVARGDIDRFISGSGDVSGAPREVPDFFVNAAYMGRGIAVYGEGLPPGFVLATPNGDLAVDYLSGALDIVAHEIAHGVLEHTSDLIFENESGALNEAFCDIVGTGVEFFFQPPGSGRGRADYLIAEDVLSPAAARSFAAPAALGQPDHYSRRFTGRADNGGVHINSGIVNHAFYLAVEGGTHATSGVAVAGVGADDRALIETAFFRAFTLLLPASASFSTARAATIQSAIDLYGAGSPAAAAITDAWAAVGVP